MPFRRISACCVLLWLGAAVCAHGQSSANPARQSVPRTSVRSKIITPAQLLDADEELAILEVALDTRRPARRGERRSDCSHLVHAIYEKAGFPYSYARSSDLYLGTEDFRRVAQPQAGDLVVWRGHAGIVINPREHTFFSSLRSGFGVQPYDSAYWKGRGRPHFLRYVKRSPASVLAASNHALSLKPTAMHSAPSPEPLPLITRAGTVDPEDEDDSTSPTEAPSELSIARTIALPAHPRLEQVRAALTAAFRDSADALAGQDFFRMSSPVVCFDQYEVRRIQHKGNKDWVEMRLTAPNRIAEKPARGAKIAETQRWNLRRKDAKTWELSLPEDAIYLPRAEAVRILSRQLADLSASGSGTKDGREKQSQLARWLDTLLDMRTR